MIMGQSLARLLVHSVFSTKERRPFLRSEEIRTEIYAYIAGIVRNLQSPSIIIGGAEDHIHILSSLSKNVALSELIGASRVPQPSVSKKRASTVLHGKMVTARFL